MKPELAEAAARIRSRVTVAASGCWEYGGSKDPGGYARASYDGIPITAHRIMCAYANDMELEELKVAGHRCDNRACVNPDHLFPTDWAGNVHDMVRKGRAGMAVLTPEQIPATRQFYWATGVTMKEAAEYMGLPKAAVNQLLNGTTWKSIPMDAGFAVG